MLLDTTEKSDIELLNDIMAELPDSSIHTEERRKYSLTKDDVLIIFRIAKIASGHQCPFEGIEKSEADTIMSVGTSITRTQKIATGILITGIVGAVISGIWYAIKHVVTEWVHGGGMIK